MNEIKKQLEDLGFVQQRTIRPYYTKKYKLFDLLIMTNNLSGALFARVSYSNNCLTLKEHIDLEWITDFDKLMSHK